MLFGPKARPKRMGQCRLSCRGRCGESGLLGHQDAQRGVAPSAAGLSREIIRH